MSDRLRLLQLLESFGFKRVDFIRPPNVEAKEYGLFNGCVFIGDGISFGRGVSPSNLGCMFEFDEAGRFVGHKIEDHSKVTS